MATYREQLRVRVISKVHRVDHDACWPWPGKTNKQGYGMVWDKEAPGKESLAHRVAYEFAHGPTKLCVLHSCDNPPCCNPKHLHAGTRTQNAAERDAKRRHQRGEDHYAAKVSDAIVTEIRALYSTGSSTRELADRFNLKRVHVWKIVKKHIRRDT